MSQVVPIKEPRPQAIAPAGMLANAERFNFMMSVADQFARSQMIPQHFRGKPADVLIALHVAERQGDDPLMVMQNMMVINGTPGFKTQYIIAKANASGKFKGPIRFSATGEGKHLEVTASAYLTDGSGEVVTAAASMAMAEADGWTKNPKYRSMPEHMLRWRAAAMLVRLYAPEVLLGFYTTEEVETFATPVESVRVDRPKSAPVPAPVEPPPPALEGPTSDEISTAADDLAEAATRGGDALAAQWAQTPKAIKAILKRRLDAEWKPAAKDADAAAQPDAAPMPADDFPGDK